MLLRDYKSVVASIEGYRNLDCQEQLMQDYPDLDAAELFAILSQEVQKIVKKKYYWIAANVEKHYNQYIQLTEGKKQSRVLLDLARKLVFSPAMLASMVLEHYLKLHPEPEPLSPTAEADRSRASPPPLNHSTPLNPSANNRRSSTDSDVVGQDVSGGDSLNNLAGAVEGLAITQENTTQENKHDITQENTAANARTSVRELTAERSDVFNQTSNSENVSQNKSSSAKFRRTKLIRDTALIPDKILGYEVHLCLVADQFYGHFADALKHSVGHEYEVMLHRKLSALGIPFQTEDDLRDLGCDKTPDIKLHVPIGVGGRVVNWIESKALFGDRENHKDYLNNQYKSYYNRFGPGLVLYWFGFIDELNEADNKRFLIRDEFPADVETYDPLAIPFETADKLNLTA